MRVSLSLYVFERGRELAISKFEDLLLLRIEYFLIKDTIIHIFDGVFLTTSHFQSSGPM